MLKSAVANTGSKTNLVVAADRPESPPKQAVEKLDLSKHEENNEKWTPLLDKSEKLNA